MHHKKKTIPFSASIIIGFTVGIFCIIYSIKLAGNISLFWDPTSFYIIIGGTLGSLIVSFPARTLKNLGSVIKKAFSKDKYNLANDIDIIVALSQTAKRQGMLSLEKVAEQEIDDAFIKRSVFTMIDSKDTETFKSLMETEIYFMQQRHQEGIEMVGMIASTAPSLGLLGTYVGLIPMLVSLDDPTTLGPLMAVELVSSFYGAFISYIIFSPMAKRLKALNKNEILRKEMIIEGLAAIKDGKNPMVIKEEFSHYIAEKREKNKSLGSKPGIIYTKGIDNNGVSHEFR